MDNQRPRDGGGIACAASGEWLLQTLERALSRISASVARNIARLDGMFIRCALEQAGVTSCSRLSRLGRRRCRALMRSCRDISSRQVGDDNAAKATVLDFQLSLSPQYVAKNLPELWGAIAVMAMLLCFVLWSSPVDFRMAVGLLSPLSSGMRRLKLCLSMPWAIAPALLVLWGVCWMFYSGEQIDQAELGTALDVAEVWFDSFNCPPQGLYGNSNSPDPLTFWTSDAISAEYLDPSVSLLRGPSFTTLDPESLAHITEESATLLHDFPHLEDSHHGGVARCPQWAPELDLTQPPLTVSGSHPHLALVATTPGSGIISPPLAPDINQQIVPPMRFGTQQRSGRTSTTSARRMVAGLVSRLEGTVPQNTYSLPPTRLPTCPGCGKRFSRPDALRRHMAEQKHGQGRQTTGNSSAREYLCPTIGCQRSINGSGFKRPSHVREHLKTCGKTSGSAMSAPEVAKSTMSPTSLLQGRAGGRDSASPLPRRTEESVVPEGSADGLNRGFHAGDSREGDNPTGDWLSEERTVGDSGQRDSGRLSEEDRVSALEQCYRVEEEELLTLEQECRRRRERLDYLRGVINLFMEDVAEALG